MPTCDECKRVFPNAWNNCRKNVVNKSNSSSTARVVGDAYASSLISPASASPAALPDATAGEELIPFEAAPLEWQILFKNEITEEDSLVASIVNVILQFGNAIEDLDENLVIKAIASVAGVEENQALLLHSFDGKEMYTSSVVDTDSGISMSQDVVNYLLTVSVGIVTPKPKEMAAKLGAVKTSVWSTIFAEDANMNFLPWSLTAGVKYISTRMIDTDSARSMAKIVPAADIVL